MDAAYREAVAGKAEAMKKMGLIASEVAIASAKPIAPGHYLAAAEWRLRFAPKGKSAAEAAFEISYVIRVVGKDVQILLAISHEDEARTLSALGLA